MNMLFFYSVKAAEIIGTPVSLCVKLVYIRLDLANDFIDLIMSFGAKI